MNTTARRRPIRLGLAAVALVASAGLAACGDDDAADTTTTTAAGQTTTEQPGGDAAQAGPTITDPWVRPAADLTASNRTAVYFRMTGGTEDDALLAASVPAEVAGAAEVHETVPAEDGEGGGSEGGHMGGTSSTMPAEGGMDGGSMGDDPSTTMGGGMMTMREVERIELPAGETVVLEPGGYHVMLLDLAAPLELGDTVEVTLTFEVAGDVVVTAEVREP